MNKNLFKIFFTLAVFLILPNFAKAEVIFEDNFDAQSDWQPKPAGLIDDCFPGGTAAHDFTDATDPYNTPSNWSFFRSTGIWYGPTYQETIRITDHAGHGVGSADGNGKSFIVYNEAHIGASGDGWGADGMLSKLFDQDYPELYARIWLRTQADWKWANNNDMLIKMFRIKHFDRSGSIFLNFTGGNNSPLFLWQFKHSNSWGTRWVNSITCDPQATDYYCTTNVSGDHLFVAGDMNVEPNSPGMVADTAWHQLDFHLKMNTYEPTNQACIDNGLGGWCSNGIYQFSYDGVMGENHSDVAWKRTGSDESVGWNTVDLGGNAFNNYNNEWVTNHAYNIDDIVVQNSYTFKVVQAHLSGELNRPGFTTNAYWQNTGLISGQKEQWYAMDDVVVSTTAIPEDYVIGGIDVIAPAGPTGLSVL
ncbi:MAG: hypothetical protein HGA36_04075 [Candidatus Moranbacteria bacterium]|nr:hypothetical protein [Candidatus Moranbacteria bacterium]